MTANKAGAAFHHGLLDQMEANSDDFATTPPAGVKSLKLEPPDLPVTAALLYARTG